MRGQIAVQEAGTQAGKESCEDSAEDQKGQIGEYAGGCSDDICGEELPQIVGQTTQGTCEVHLFFV